MDTRSSISSSSSLFSPVEAAAVMKQKGVEEEERVPVEHQPAIPVPPLVAVSSSSLFVTTAAAATDFRPTTKKEEAPVQEDEHDEGVFRQESATTAVTTTTTATTPVPDPILSHRSSSSTCTANQNRSDDDEDWIAGNWCWFKDNEGKETHNSVAPAVVVPHHEWQAGQEEDAAAVSSGKDDDDDDEHNAAATAVDDDDDVDDDDVDDDINNIINRIGLFNKNIHNGKEDKDERKNNNDDIDVYDDDNDDDDDDYGFIFDTNENNNNDNKENNHSENTSLAPIPGDQIMDTTAIGTNQQDTFDEDWTAGNWCWILPQNSNSDDGVATTTSLAVAVASYLMRRRKRKTTLERSREDTDQKKPRYSTQENDNPNNNNATNMGNEDDTSTEMVGDDTCYEMHDDDGDDNDSDERDEDENDDGDDDDDGDDEEEDDDDDDDDDDDNGNESELYYDSGNDSTARTTKLARSKKVEIIQGSETTFNKKRWNDMFGRLLKYKKKYKSASVPYSFDGGRHLGRWVTTQRYHYTKKILSENRINRLESIDFVWNLSNHLNWVEMCKRLVAYKKQYKSTCVPYRSKESDIRQLGKWVSTQRLHYKTKDPVLTIEKISQLDSIGFVWNVCDAQWIEMYERLVAYKKRYKSTRVPQRYEADLKLGKWVNQQRIKYRSTKSPLTIDRINRLNSINFIWNAKST